MQDTGAPIGPISGGCFTAIVAPKGRFSVSLSKGEGEVIADLDFALIDGANGSWTCAAITAVPNCSAF